MTKLTGQFAAAIQRRPKVLVIPIYIVPDFGLLSAGTLGDASSFFEQPKPADSSAQRVSSKISFLI